MLKRINMLKFNSIIVSLSISRYLQVNPQDIDIDFAVFYNYASSNLKYLHTWVNKYDRKITL